MLQGALLKRLSIALTVLLAVSDCQVYLPVTILKLHLEEREKWKGKARDVCTSNKAGTEGSKFLLCSVIVIGHLN